MCQCAPEGSPNPVVPEASVDADTLPYPRPTTKKAEEVLPGLYGVVDQNVMPPLSNPSQKIAMNPQVGMASVVTTNRYGVSK